VSLKLLYSSVVNDECILAWLSVRVL
jgi:hypothetical protein